MSRKFKYAPGLPGYGTRGVDGSIGISGISTYFSSYSGDSDEILIDIRISENKLLIGSDDASIPGWPNRVYQSGDIIIDSIGKVWEIDLLGTPRFSYTGTQLASTDSLFTQGPASTKSPTYSRYYNDFDPGRILIDFIYAQGGVTTGYAVNRKSYGIEGRNYGHVQYVNYETDGYHPYTMWSNSDQIGDDNAAIALVKVHNQDSWHFGARDDSDNVRPIDLYLDFENVHAGNIYGTFLGTIQSPNLHLTGWLRVDGDSSLNNTLYVKQNLILDGSIRTRNRSANESGLGFPLELIAGNGGGNTGQSGGDIRIISGKGGSDPGNGVPGLGGSLSITAGRGGDTATLNASARSGGGLLLLGGQGGDSTGSARVGGSGGSINIRGGVPGISANPHPSVSDPMGGHVVIYGGSDKKDGFGTSIWVKDWGNTYLGHDQFSKQFKGYVFTSDGSGALHPALIIGDSSMGFYSTATNRISISQMSGTSPGERFRFDASTFHATGNIIAYSSMPSDIRLKEDVEPLHFSLEKILNLKGVTYTRKGTSERHIGFIAQEVEQYIPEVIVETNMIGYPDEEIYKTINYTEIIPHLVEAVKSQQKVIHQQSIEILELQSAVEEIQLLLKK